MDQFFLASVCCIALSVLFLFINIQTLERTQKQYNTEKLQIVLEDLEQQIITMKEINVLMHLNNNNIYQPYYFQAEKYNEIPLLNDFGQYIRYSPLIGECFLYYSGLDNIFYANKDAANTVSLTTFLSKLRTEETTLLTHTLESDKLGAAYLPLSNGLYIILPFKASNMYEYINASLCFIVSYETLSTRMQLVSGGLMGDTALYNGDTLLYASDTNAPGSLFLCIKYTV